MLTKRSRVLLAYDRELCADVLAAFVGARQRSLRWRAKRALGLGSVGEAEIGAVTFVQRCAAAEVLPPSEALAEVGGVNVHAGAAIDGRDRKRLERLCRYIARPPLAQERLEEHGDGRLRYRFKRAWRNGTYAVVLEPLDLVARLVALIPPPRFHMLRYHGVLAAHAKARRASRHRRASESPDTHGRGCWPACSRST